MTWIPTRRLCRYTVECRLLKRESPTSVLTYQRLSPKICSDRDYTLRIHQTSHPVPAGLVFLDRWELANQWGPPEKPNVLRIKMCEGSWLLEPDGNDKTRATYSVYADNGGAIPDFSGQHGQQDGRPEYYRGRPETGAIAKIFGKLTPPLSFRPVERPCG